MNKSAWRQEHIWPCCIRIICTTIGQFANSRQVNTLMERILNRVLKNQSESNQKDLTEQRKPSKEKPVATCEGSVIFLDQSKGAME